MGTSGRTAVVLALLAGLNSACSTSATVERRSGPTMVGTIESSDANRLYLAVGEGERHWIERSDVTDIEHPGVIGTIGGAILTTLGVGFLAWAPFLRNDCPYDCMASNRGLAIVAGAATLLSGVPVMISNLKRYRRSRAAAEPPR